jgi:hypothetical protein
MTGLRAFVDLVTTIGGILEGLNSNIGLESRTELVLQLDNEMDSLRERVGLQAIDSDLAMGDNRTATAGSILRQIHYNWYVVPCVQKLTRQGANRIESPISPRQSSTAFLTIYMCKVCNDHLDTASSGKLPLNFPPDTMQVISSALLNLPWMQLRRTEIAIYIVFIAFWRSEVTQLECETAINDTLEVLCVFGTRWQSATSIAAIVMQLADKTGTSQYMAKLIVQV